MKKVNAIVMNYEEFEDLLCKISWGHAGIGFESGEWFYVSDDEYDIDNINKDLSMHLDVTVKAVRIDNTVNESEVIVIYD